MKIKIKYFNEDYPRLEKTEKGDFIDLRVDTVEKYECVQLGELANDEISITDDKLYYKKGDVIRLGLGVAMQLPLGYEAIVVPRSSTYTHWGFIQTNSMGVIDQKYQGDNDLWMIEFYATRDGSISRFDRVCQFRIQENQPNLSFEEVNKLTGENRDGYGSSGVQ